MSEDIVKPKIPITYNNLYIVELIHLKNQLKAEIKEELREELSREIREIISNQYNEWVEVDNYCIK